MKTKTNKSVNTLKEETELLGQNVAPAKENKKSGPRLWQSVLVGGVPGILIGASGIATLDAMAAAIPEPELAPEAGSELLSTSSEVFEAHGVNDEMLFNEAFAAARGEVGPGGAFVWHGHVYGTYRGDDPEWQEMTAEQRAEHSQLIMSKVHPTPYTPSENEPSIVPNPEDPSNDLSILNENRDEIPDEKEQIKGSVLSNDANEGEEDASGHTADDGQDEGVDGVVDVHIVGQDNADTESGDLVRAGFSDEDGQDAVFADADGDGEVDTVLIDEEEDLEVEEISEIDDQEMTLDDEDTLDDQLYADMLDYTNDADTSSLV